VSQLRLSSIYRSAGLLLCLQAAASAQFTAAPGSPMTVNQDPCCVAVGDFNGDGIPDLAVLSPSTSTVTILLGIGDGTFRMLPSGTGNISVGDVPVSIAVADFNGDGMLDLAIASQNQVSGNNIFILTGNGDGTFAPATQANEFPVGTSPSFILAADLADDGYPDLAVTDLTGGTITVLRNNSLGPGTFDILPAVPVGNSPFSIAVNKLNGSIYMAVANRFDGTVSLLKNTGEGYFTVTNTIPVISPNPDNLTPYPTAVVLADFNGDGLPDIATANQGTNNITVLLSNRFGTYTSATGSPFSAGPGNVGAIGLVAADFNNDGTLDLAAVSGTDSTLTILLGNGQGVFTAAAGTPPSPGPAPFGMAVGDFNLDGKLDLVIADNAANTITVLLNGFPSTFAMVSSASGTPSVAPGSIVSIYGSAMAASTAVAPPTEPALPMSLGGANVTIIDSNQAQTPLPLFYVSPTQINALIPTTVAIGEAAISIFTGTATQTGHVAVTPIAPELYAANQNGVGVAWAQFVNNIYQITDVFQCSSGSAGTCTPVPLDLTNNCPATGCVLVLYGTGLPDIDTNNVNVMVGGESIPAAYAGPSSYAGEDQINVSLPATLAGSGLVSVMLSVKEGAGAITSNILTVYIQ
jgi:uncharacterized protein (TIGR03437 family)